MKTTTLLYFSQFLSAWGDRMWKFAIAMFLMNLEPESFQLIGVYGLVLACTVLIFAPLVGDWIDNTGRLFSVQVTLCVQNLAVVICAVMFLVYNVYDDSCMHACRLTIKIFAVFLGAIALLASVGTHIILDKDWIVVITKKDSGLLASVNATVRRIDLATKLLAPIACGQIIFLTSLAFACGFIAVWNVISMIIEYAVLKIIYNRTPDLQKPKGSNTTQTSNDEDVEMNDLNAENSTLKNETDTHSTNNSESSSTNNESKEEEKRISVHGKMFSFIIIIGTGWKNYSSQSVSKAGFGLSCLYMTVLGFDSITIAYAYSQCFSEFLLSLMVAGAAVTGIVATFLFPVLEKHLGLVKAGTVSSIAQLLTLIPTILSLFIIGSPFQITEYTNNSPLMFENTTSPIGLQNITSAIVLQNNTLISPGHPLFFKCLKNIEPPESYLSLFVLMASIIAARVGLWLFDLTVTQLFQTTVPEKERGVVGGVQSSLNNLMDLLHFILVIILSRPSEFGILVILSCIFVCLGHFSYALFVCGFNNVKPVESNEV